jgi:hypothetical protein
MLSPFGNGHHLGYPRERGRSRETGPSYRYLAPAGGALCGKARQLASRCGEAGRGPSISYMEGPYLIVPAGISWPQRHGTSATAGKRRRGGPRP